MCSTAWRRAWQGKVESCLTLQKSDILCGRGIERDSKEQAVASLAEEVQRSKQQ